MAYAAAGLALAILLRFLRMRFAAHGKINRMRDKLPCMTSPDDQKRFAQFLKLAEQSREKVREALENMKPRRSLPGNRLAANPDVVRD